MWYPIWMGFKSCVSTENDQKVFFQLDHLLDLFPLPENG